MKLSNTIFLVGLVFMWIMGAAQMWAHMTDRAARDARVAAIWEEYEREVELIGRPGVVEEVR